MTGAGSHRAVCIGVHIVDALGRPVTAIPPGQGRELLEEIRITVAGTAAGTSLTLAKLGISVSTMGAIGDDTLADFLCESLRRSGVDPSRLARKAGTQTSATLLPIRPNGERPALHCPGATSLLTLQDIDLDAVRAPRTSSTSAAPMSAASSEASRPWRSCARRAPTARSPRSTSCRAATA